MSDLAKLDAVVQKFIDDLPAIPGGYSLGVLSPSQLTPDTKIGDIAAPAASRLIVVTITDESGAAQK